MPGEIVYLTTRSQVVKYLETHTFVIIKFTATWCGPCKRCAPLVESLFKSMPETVSMIIVDIDKGADIKQAMKIKSVPTLVNFVNSNMMDSVIGANNDHINSFFKKTLKRSCS